MVNISFNLDISPNPIKVDTPTTITVTSSSTGEYYYAIIRNKCTMKGIYWELDPSHEEVIDNIHNAKWYENTNLMIDNGDNTYTYTFTPTRPGEVVIFIKYYKFSGVHFTSSSEEQFFNGPISRYGRKNKVDVEYADGVSFENWESYWSVMYEFSIIAPITGTVNLKISADAKAHFIYEEEPLVEIYSHTDQTFPKTMTAGK